MLSGESATVNGKSISTYPVYIRRTLTEDDAQYLKQALLSLSDSSYASETLLNWIYRVAYSRSPSITAGPLATLDALFSQYTDENAELRSTVAPTLYGGTAVAADAEPYFMGTRATQLSVEDFIPGDVLVCDHDGTGYMYLFFDGFVELTDGMAVADTSSVLELANNANRYAVIRPSIAYSSMPLSEGMTNPEDLNTAQKALLVTASNYLLLGERIQYDDSRLSSISKAEFRWKKGAVTPENYTADQWGYTNCAAFCYDLYLYGIGQDIGSYTTSALMNKTGWRKYYYQPTGTESAEEATAQIDKFFAAVQVGDLIVIRRDTDGNGSDDSGHAMVYIGDKKVIHSTGSSYSYTNSAETYEPSIRYMDIYTYLFAPDSTNYLFGSKVSKLAVIRPLSSFSGSIPEESQNRVDSLSGIRVEKLSSCKPSVSVNPGDEITFSFRILNANSDARTVTITDIVPENTEFVSVNGGTETNGSISFEVSVEACQTATVSYTVRVKDIIDSADATVRGDAAKANGVSLACPAVRIGNTLTASEQSAITEAIAYYAESNTEELSAIPLVNAIYEKAGFAAPFGASESILAVAAGVVEKYKVNGSSNSFRLAENGKYSHLLADGQYGGRYLYTAEFAFLNGGNRTRLPQEHNLVVGDIISPKQPLRHISISTMAQAFMMSQPRFPRAWIPLTSWNAYRLSRAIL